jgi:hypothetical protein
MTACLATTASEGLFGPRAFVKREPASSVGQRKKPSRSTPIRCSMNFAFPHIFESLCSPEDTSFLEACLQPIGLTRLLAIHGCKFLSIGRLARFP